MRRVYAVVDDVELRMGAVPELRFTCEADRPDVLTDEHDGVGSTEGPA
jgi:hypothetical protein